MEASGIVQKLMGITLLGSEWVLWLMLGLSVVSVAVMLERMIYFVRTGISNFSGFFEALNGHLAARDLDAAKELCKSKPALESKVALIALDNAAMGPEAIQKLIASKVARERQKWDRGLVVLGTLGNNTPFIGLFGTVIGIIMAFHALAANPGGGSATVMAGISEALIATAVGLMVAIPAVIAFNAFQRVVKGRVARAEAVQEMVLAYLMRADRVDPKKAA